MAVRDIIYAMILSSTLLASGPMQAQHIIGHRGASDAAPENTLAAFRLAWRLGADGIEGDFHLSADGRIVCIHDEDTERVAGVKHVVSETSFADLRRLDVGSWKGAQWQGERIPTLEEVLATVPRGKRAYIEIKCGPEIVAPLLDALEIATVPLEDLVVISFHADVIAACEARMPKLKSYWLTSYKQRDDQTWRPDADEVVRTIRRIKADGLGSKAVPEHVNEIFISTLRSRGIDDFHVWTVDDPSVGEIYKRLGTRAITTNRPSKMRQQLFHSEN